MKETTKLTVDNEEASDHSTSVYRSAADATSPAGRGKAVRANDPLSRHEPPWTTHRDGGVSSREGTVEHSHYRELPQAAGTASRYLRRGRLAFAVVDRTISASTWTTISRDEPGA